MMQIFVIASDVPFRSDDQEEVGAVNIVLADQLLQFKRLGHEITLQIIFNSLHDNAISETERVELEYFKILGMRILPSFFAKDYSEGTASQNKFTLFLENVRMAVKILFFKLGIHYFYPTFKLTSVLSDRLRKSGCEVVFLFGSPEGLGAVYGFHELPKIAYHGGLDYHAEEVKLKDYAIFYPQLVWWKRGLAHLKLIQNKWVFATLIRDMDGIAYPNASDREFYEKIGYKKDFFAGVTWKDKEVDFDRYKRAPEQTRPFKIIGYVGNLGHTSGTYALQCLLVEIVPILKELLKDLDYEIHIIGTGTVRPFLRPWLAQDHIIQRGWVKSLEGELTSSDVFLLLDNAGSSLVACTRQMVAWSLGLCLVTHARNAKVYPETTHMKNALMGGAADEIAQMVGLALRDFKLNMNIRLGGRRTFEDFYRPNIVAKKICNEMEQLVSERKTAWIN